MYFSPSATFGGPSKQLVVKRQLRAKGHLVVVALSVTLLGTQVAPGARMPRSSRDCELCFLGGREANAFLTLRDQVLNTEAPLDHNAPAVPREPPPPANSKTTTRGAQPRLGP